MKPEKKVLFILKERHTSHSNLMTISSGLFNSANFVVDMLNKNGIETHLVEVKDNNQIDREVKKYKPTHVVIEALWVIPSKFEVLTKLHPKVEWIVRLHSDIPFLANEGISIEWIYEYLKYDKVKVSANLEKTNNELSSLVREHLLYLPNYYPVGFFNVTQPRPNERVVLNVGCFGAVRPLKNQLIQAIAAIKYANTYGKKLRFHINVARVEGRGEPVLKNIKSLFDNNPQHELVEHQWLTHDEFIDVVQRMDLGMQVSFSETFNIVTADFVNNNIPVVVSDEISWVSKLFKSKTTEVDSIVRKMRIALLLKTFKGQFLNKFNLFINSVKAEKTWVNYFKP
jgi:hypothetical protein